MRSLTIWIMLGRAARRGFTDGIVLIVGFARRPHFFGSLFQVITTSLDDWIPLLGGTSMLLSWVFLECQSFFDIARYYQNAAFCKECTVRWGSHTRRRCHNT
jgi:hypothetical protein